MYVRRVGTSVRCSARSCILAARRPATARDRSALPPAYYDSLSNRSHPATLYDRSAFDPAYWDHRSNRSHPASRTLHYRITGAGTATQPPHPVFFHNVNQNSPRSHRMAQGPHAAISCHSVRRRQAQAARPQPQLQSIPSCSRSSGSTPPPSDPRAACGRRPAGRPRPVVCLLLLPRATSRYGRARVARRQTAFPVWLRCSIGLRGPDFRMSVLSPLGAPHSWELELRSQLRRLRRRWPRRRQPPRPHR
jgi:hypothetical protein